MTAQTSATTTAPVISFAVVARKHRDGSVVLSTATDRIFKLNGVGALTWTVLAQSENGLTLDEVVAELYRQFEGINIAGELRYEITREQLGNDTSRFLKSL